MSMVPGAVGTASSFPDGASIAGGIRGVTNGSSATAGDVGQAVRSYAGFTNVTTSNQYQNVTSISLTAGDWDVTALGGLQFVSGTVTSPGNHDIAISTDSGTGTPPDRNVVDNQVSMPFTSSTDVGTSIANYRVSISSTTTYYLKVRTQFGGGSVVQVAGRLSARRVR